MAFQIPSLRATIDYVLAVGRAIWPDRAFDSDYSYHARKATYAAASVTQLHAHVAAVQRDAFPTTAGQGKPIQDWGELWGLEPKAATPARKSAAARVVGSFGSTAAVDSELTHQATGLRFKLASTATIVNAAPNNFVDADIVAIDTGAVTRLAAGSVLRFVNTIPGITSNVRLQRDLDEDGEDAEPFGAFRARVLQVAGSVAAGGNASDWVRWVESLSGIAKGYSLGNRAGVGSQDIVAFHSATGSSRVLNAAERASVLTELQELAPNQLAGTGGQLRVLTTVPDYQPVELAIVTQAATAYQFDWDDTTPLVVASYNNATRTVTVTGFSLPTSMKAGHRVIISGVATAQDGRQYKIQAIAGATSFILETAPPVDPAAGDVLYSGGPLVDPIRNAVLAHLNGEDVYAVKGAPVPASSLGSTVGLEVLAEGIGPANPLGKYGTWIGGIVVSVLGKIAGAATGVRDVYPIVPAANYEPLDDPFPSDSQIHFVVPSSVIVRRKT